MLSRSPTHPNHPPPAPSHQVVERPPLEGVRVSVCQHIDRTIQRRGAERGDIPAIHFIDVGPARELATSTTLPVVTEIAKEMMVEVSSRNCLLRFDDEFCSSVFRRRVRPKETAIRKPRIRPARRSTTPTVVRGFKLEYSDY